MKMARKRRIEFLGAFYHVLARGNNKQVVFRDDQDYIVYISRIKRYQKRYNFKLYAYVLMPNHVHLLIETDVIPLSKIMQGIQQSYTIYFHKKYESVGHLFQGRYKAILCDQDTYLLELVRYIHLNPVRASLVDNPDDYVWSSHPVYLGYLDQDFVKKDFIFIMFSETESLAKDLYCQFIRDGLNIGYRKEFYDVVDQLYLGSPEFVARIERKIRDKIQKDDLKRVQNIQYLHNQLAIKIKSLDKILKLVSDVTGFPQECILSRSRTAKVSNIRALYAFVSSRYAGISNKSLAAFLGRECSTVANMIRKIEEKIVSDLLLANQVDKVMKLMKV